MIRKYLSHRSLWDYLPVVLISLGFIVASIIAMHGAFIHPELYDRIPHLLSHKGFLSKIYDSQVMDYGMYQARELSYLADEVDVLCIYQGIKHGMPNMISFMHYLLAFALVLLIYEFSLKTLQLGRLPSLFIAAAVWATPFFFYGGNYFRSAKIGAATTLVIVYVTLYGALKKIFAGGKCGIATSVLLASACFVMTLWDRQGFYLALCLAAFLLVVAITTRNKDIMILFAVLVAVIVTSMVYNLWIAPCLTKLLNGYWPDFTYQRLPVHEVFQNLGMLLKDAAVMRWEESRYTLGNSFYIPILGILIAFPIYTYYAKKEVGWSPLVVRWVAGVTVGLFLVTILLMIVMNALMMARMRGLYIPIFRRTYYPLPLAALILLNFSVILGLFRAQFEAPSWLITALCTLLLFGNLMALPSHRDAYYNGYLKHFIDPSQEFFVAIKEATQGQPVENKALLDDPLFRFLAWELRIKVPEHSTFLRHVPF